MPFAAGRPYAVLAALILSACCAGEQQERIHLYARDAYVEVDGARLPFEPDVFLQPADAGLQRFREVQNIVARGGEDYEALLVGAPVTPGGSFAIALPTPLRSGAVYRVGRAFPPPEGADVPGGLWAGRDLAGPGEAEVALRSGGFTATRATGTVEVTVSSGGTVDLRLDLAGTDASGRTMRLHAEVLRLAYESFTPPC